MENKEKYIEDIATYINNNSALTWISSIALAEKLYEVGYTRCSVGVWKPYKEYYADEYSECNTRNVWTCSICGRIEQYKQPYCNCGAKMKD